MEMYWYYLISATILAALGVYYGIFVQKRQNFGKKLQELACTSMSYNECLAILGKPTKEYVSGDSKTVLWRAADASATIRFHLDGTFDELINAG